MKLCVTCNELRSEDDFYWRNKLLRKRWNTCKFCQKDQRAAWYQKNKTKHKKTAKKNKKIAIANAKEFVWVYLSTHPCVDCGASDPHVLEFDHIKGIKWKTLSQLTGEGYSIEAIKKEISKCVVRCANCHRLKTAKERGWFRS